MFSSFGNVPWLNNVRNVVDNAVHEITNAADSFANNIQNADRQGRRQQQQQQRGGGGFPAAAAAAAYQQQQQQQQHQQENRRAPVASGRAIRQLPTIRVAPEDLVEPSNRECCICLEENKLGERVTRLPCAHIFHSECVVDWLTNHSCTCPVCRYELATDDPFYESGRMERMKTRKPRYAMYELQRMTVSQLLALFRTPPRGVCEKKDLIQRLVDEERIHLIRAPEPVNYKLQSLQSMRISELKRVMADAGVFFHAKDVVEKSDMVTIFRNSGRLNLIPEDDNDGDDNEDSSSQQKEEVETTDEKSVTTTTPLDSLDGTAKSDSSDSSNKKRPLVETVEDEGGDDDEPTKQNSTHNSRSPDVIDMFAAANSQDMDDRTPITEVEPNNNIQSQASDISGTHDYVDDPPRPEASTSGSETSVPPSEETTVPPSADTIEINVTENAEEVDTTSQDPVSVGSASVGNESAEATDPAVVVRTAEPQPVNALLENEMPASRIQHNQETQPEDKQDLEMAEGDLETADNSSGNDRPPSAIQHNQEGLPEEEQGTVDESSLPAGSLESSRSGNSAPLDSTNPTTTNEITADEIVANEDGPSPVGTTTQRINDYSTGTPTMRDSSEDNHFQDCSIAQLRAMCEAAGVDSSQCCERRELVALLSKVGEAQNPNPAAISRSDLSTWSVSQLRALASVVRIDLSQCSNQDEMIDKILKDVNTERQYLRNYIRALAPLAVCSVSELRGIARAWGVNISDCLEKDEIINRLISAFDRASV